MDSARPGERLLDKLAELHPRRFFFETWAAIDREAEEERRLRRERGEGYDYRPAIAFSMGAVFLIAMEEWGMPRDLAAFLRLLASWGAGDGDPYLGLRRGPFWELSQHAYWACWRVLGFFLLPIAIIKLSGQRIRDQGLSTRGIREHAYIYVLAYLVVLLCVVVVSFDAEFTSYYPFYRRSDRSLFDLLLWELLYAAQFFSLEFFFRGWWLSAGRGSMGSQAIFAMVVPYVMIHFTKPAPEIFAAILAGIFLGTLAMKTRSIWSGFFIHVSVALSMDVAALLQTSGLPTRWWP